MTNVELDPLLERAAAGDTAAREELLTHFEERLKRMLRVRMDRRLAARIDPSDVVQEAYMEAWQKLSTFDPRYRFFSWIYKITVNECLNLINRRRRTEPLDPEVELPSREDTSSRLRAREASERVQKALLRLSPRHREVVILRHFLEMSYGEIAEMLAIPQKTVKSRLYEARQRLVQLLPENTS